MNSIELSEVSALAPHVHSGEQVPLFVTENGHTVAAIVHIDDADKEDFLLSINPQFQSILERSQRRFEKEGGVSSDEIRKRLDLPPS
jgi:hypothetical protein